MDEGRDLLLRTMESNHWQPAEGSHAWLDRMTLDPRFGNLGAATTFGAFLVAANGENLAGLSTLYRWETGLNLPHYAVARSFVEYASDAWWVLSPGAIFEEELELDPSLAHLTEKEALATSNVRLARAMLLYAEDLRQHRIAIEERDGTGSEEAHSATHRYETQRGLLSQWSGQKLEGRPIDWVISGERLGTYTDRVSSMIQRFWPDVRSPVYRIFSNYTHANAVTLLHATTTTDHDGHLHYNWLPDYVELERLARMVLFVWERTAQALLAMYGYSSDAMDAWRGKIDKLVPDT